MVSILVMHLLESTIPLINHYPPDNFVGFGSNYIKDSDLSAR